MTRLMHANTAFAAVIAAGLSLQASTARLEVRESASGAYVVTARFTIEAPAPVIHAVLTDYENIPRFMPDVVESRVRERRGSTVTVEQEAVSTFMFFSKRVHLALEIQEAPSAITFRDTAGRSFDVYSGSWQLEASADGTGLTYSLIAKPSFAVPEFVIKRLLDRNARRMIDQLRAEIDARAGK